MTPCAVIHGAVSDAEIERRVAVTGPSPIVVRLVSLGMRMLRACGPDGATMPAGVLTPSALRDRDVTDA